MQATGSADDASPGPFMGPARGSGLRRRAIAPVKSAPREQRPLLRNRDVGVGRRAARFDETDAEVRILAQACGEHTAGGTGAHDQRIETFVHWPNQLDEW